MDENTDDDKNTRLIRLLESNPEFLDDMENSKQNTTATSQKKRTHEGTKHPLFVLTYGRFLPRM